MKKRAVAYYKTAYTSNYYLSFAWVVWDIIDQVRLEKRLPIKMDAIGERISNEIHMKEFTKFDVIQKGLQKTCPAVIPYLERYDGLGKLLYFVIKWMGQQHFLDSINKPKICLLFVQFALGVLPRPKGFYPFLEE
uniref:RNA-directed RNA polymerase n=1 Tax=Panagrolaimus sp. JU765 TaxID=591449 RepID=A0AC34RHK9_9BILA